MEHRDEDLLQYVVNTLWRLIFRQQLRIRDTGRARRRPAPHSTVERLSVSFLPPAIHHFLFSQSEELVLAHLALRALCGGVSGTVLLLGIAHSLPLTFDLKLAAGGVFVGVCVVCGALSSSFRCSVLLMFPSMLGSRGRTYLMVFILSVLCTGPVSNVERNVRAAALSVSCNLDLQVHHSRLLWQEAVRPFTRITQQLRDDKEGLESEALSVSRTFQSIRDEVVAQYGYSRFSPHRTASSNSTQERFTTKTMMQCDSVVDQGVQRCSDWFRRKWAECMEAIPVPVINHILCVSMKFHFLCDVMRVMTPWCREQLPVEGNFGPLFDQLNVSVDRLSRQFSTELVLQQQQQQPGLVGVVVDEQFTQSVTRSFQKLTTVMEKLLDVLQLLLSFTFISLFTSAFSYLRQYRRDVRFDNVYITTYFRQIDSRRRGAGKRCLLPLTRSERRKFIDPGSLRIHPDEWRQVTAGVFQVLSVSLLCVVLLTVDFSLVHVLDIVSRHTVTHFNLSSSHQVNIKVGGASMMARLLRKTVSAFNSSSDLHIHTHNRGCVAPPSSLSAGVYVSCVCCVLLVALFTCIQVYSNRLRRVIAAFYHPQREKRRVLFLYNLQIQRRIFSMDRKRIITRGRGAEAVFQCVSRFGRHLCCRHGQDGSDSETHYDPG
ncbi:E3 ubiquitin-protein ligase DCST1 isoform X5 [Scophthalmus maximus]|uniref:E3 ubiquitin-protein ligase DCST1 isoform X5 n=1 Tax=Scophthalmus maximus TaxID=52904 RepID=UPI001FA87DE0|nr:E3 ubiquitin-protein ligase DCST1 isoform X5 [Scophthalmus maximus]